VPKSQKDGSDRFFEAFHFDDNEATADELAALVLAGKRAVHRYLPDLPGQ
jgi:uncharacterized protein YhfF